MISDDFNGTSIDGTLWTTVTRSAMQPFAVSGKKLTIGVAEGGA